MTAGSAALQALRRDPSRADLHLAYAIELENSGEIAPAVAHYQRTVALAPDDDTLHDRLIAAMSTDMAAERLVSDYVADRFGPNDGSMKPVVVISHERSGTHLLINTLAFNFGYLSLWIDAVPDLSSGWPDFRPFLDGMKERGLTNVVKSHHARSLFPDDLDRLAADVEFFYIVRDGRDVLTSFWNFARNAEINEGLVAESAAAFMRAVPEGRPLVYDPHPHVNMLGRWAANVEGWLPATDSGAVTLIRFEDLTGDFDATLDRIGRRIGRLPQHRLRPTLRFPSVAPWKGRVGNWRAYLDDDDLALFERTAGGLMKRLGYGDG